MASSLSFLWTVVSSKPFAVDLDANWHALEVERLYVLLIESEKSKLIGRKVLDAFSTWAFLWSWLQGCSLSGARLEGPSSAASGSLLARFHTTNASSQGADSLAGRNLVLWQPIASHHVFTGHTDLRIAADTWRHIVSSFLTSPVRLSQPPRQKQTLAMIGSRISLTLYRPNSQLLENVKLAFALKGQYLNNYKHYHHDRHTIGKVFSLPIRWWKV